jgi:hypothetical protein
MVLGKSARPSRRRSSILVPQVRSHGVTHDEQETKDIEVDADFYWREWLEKQMNSLGVNIFVLVTVTFDIIIAIFFLARDKEVAGGAVGAFSTSLLAETEKMFQLIWNGLVNLIFVGEITLRQMAMSGRFWSSGLNIFDFCVVWLSVLGQVGFYVLEYWSPVNDKNLTNALANAGVTRIISRVVIIARFIRVVNTLRKARNVSGQMNYAIRSVVSQNKRRLQWNGFDLDLTYITNRIVAMSVPVFGKATAYRNNIHQVSRYLALKHYGRFFIFNLCDTVDSSDGIMGQYHPSMIYNAVQRVPFEDHSPPLMSEMLYFCQEAAAWMAAHPQNIVCVHCKGGKGRTGVMIAALMMWTGHRRCARDALELFTFRRTSNYDPAKSLDGADDGAEGDEDTGENGKASGCSKFLKRLFCCGFCQSSKPNQGVEGPSQIRYVNYLQAVLYHGVDPWSNEPRFVSSIEFPSCTFRGRRVWYMSFTVRCQRIQFYDSFANNGSAVTISSFGHSSVSLPVKTNLSGDVRIDFFVHTHVAKPKRKLECFVTFNTCFCKGRDVLVFKKRNIDMFHKDRKHNKVPADFDLAINLEPQTSESLDSRFHTLFANAGQSITLRKGDKLLDKESMGDSLYFIESGYVEGVVEEDTEEAHALGSCLPHVVAEHRKCSDAQDTQQMKNNSTRQLRIPIMCILGKGSVIGASQFLTKKRGMLFRVRSSEARVLRILSTSQHHERPKSTETSITQAPSSNPRTPMLRRVGSVLTTNLRRMISPSRGGRSSGVDIQSLVDGVTDEDDGTRHRIQGIGVQDLGVFYHGFAQALVPLLDRAQVSCLYLMFICRCCRFILGKQMLRRVVLNVIRMLSLVFFNGMRAHSLNSQVEAIRISSLRALNDSESLLASENHWEMLQEACVKVTKIPVHEKLRCVFRCRVSTSGASSPRIRVLVLQNYLVLDTAYYGPIVSKNATLIRLFHMRSVRFLQV